MMTPLPFQEEEHAKNIRRGSLLCECPRLINMNLSRRRTKYDKDSSQASKFIHKQERLPGRYSIYSIEPLCGHIRRAAEEAESDISLEKIQFLDLTQGVATTEYASAKRLRSK